VESDQYKKLNFRHASTPRKEFNTISESNSYKVQSDHKGVKIPLKVNESLNKFLHTTAMSNSDIDVEKAGALMKYLSEKVIDLKILNSVRIEFLKTDINEQGWLTVDQFTKILRKSSKQTSEEVDQKIINYFKVQFHTITPIGRKTRHHKIL
jgi:hypothetical protein